MARKVLDLQWDDSKEYKFFSKEILVPFICLVLMALGPIFTMNIEGGITPYMMADLNAAKYNSLQNIIGQIIRACSALAWGGLFERYNKRNILMILSLLAIVSTIMRALALNIGMLIASVLVGSIGTGGISAGLVAMVAYLLPRKYRGWFYSVRVFFNFAMATFSPVAAWIILNMGWRWNLWFGAFSNILVLLVIFFIAPSMPATVSKENKKKFDIVGVCIFLLGTVVIFASSYMGGGILKWSNPILYILILCGLVIYYLGIQYEKKHEDIALVSTRILKNKYFMAAMLVGALYYSMFSTKSYQQLYVVQGLGMPLTAWMSVRVIPTMLGHGIGMLFPIIMEKTGKVKLVAGFIVAMNIVSALWFFFLRDASAVSVFIALCTTAATPLALGQMLVANSVEREDISKAAGTYTFVYYFSQAIFSLTYNILLNNIHALNLKPFAQAAGILDKLNASQLDTMTTYTILSNTKSLAVFKATFGADVATYEKAVKVVQDCVAAAVRPSFLVGGAFCVIAFIFVFRLKSDMKIVARKKGA